MTESKGAVLAYPRLCIAYFCQFGIWGAWAVALSEYAASVLKFGGAEIGSLYNAIPFGAVIAPLFIGPIADRYFSAQKVMSLLHFIGGLALLSCGLLCHSGLGSFPVLMGLMLLAGICFMPTMGLINSIVFKHLPKPSLAPYVFVFGTLGWIAVNLFIAGFCGGATTHYFFFVSGGMSVFLALYALTLPHTPPKGAPAPGEKSSGLAVLSLFRDFSFVIFVVCAFLASIPACNYYFPAMGSFLTERGYPSPVALATINQFSEIFLMVALPFCIARFGLKKVLLIGMAAWAIRYFCFAEPYFALAVFGLLLHGFCYTFLYVAAYMYAEKVAPENLKASAQSMMVFLLLGVGQVLGGYGYGFMRNANPPKVTGVSITIAQLDEGAQKQLPGEATDCVMVPIPAWNESEDSFFQYLDLAKQVNKLLGKKEEEKESTVRIIDLGKLLKDQPLTPQTINAMDKEQLIQDGVTLSQMKTCCGGGSPIEAITATVQFNRDDLKALGRIMATCPHCGAVVEDFSLTRSDWLAAQSHDWKKIFQLPAILIAICFVIFLVFGRDPKEEKAK